MRITLIYMWHLKRPQQHVLARGTITEKPHIDSADPRSAAETCQPPNGRTGSGQTPACHHYESPQWGKTILSNPSFLPNSKDDCEVLFSPLS